MILSGLMLISLQAQSLSSLELVFLMTPWAMKSAVVICSCQNYLLPSSELIQHSHQVVFISFFPILGVLPHILHYGPKLLHSVSITITTPSQVLLTSSQVPTSSKRVKTQTLTRQFYPQVIYFSNVDIT